MSLEYTIIFEGQQYYCEANFIRGYKGNSASPPEAPTVEIVEVRDEDGESISEELFDAMEDHIIEQVLDQEREYCEGIKQ